MIRNFVAAVAALTLAVPVAAAAKPLKIEPVAREGQSVRYDRGIATIEDDMANGAVRVVPIPSLYKGSLQFTVVAFNKSASAVNFGVENVTLRRGEERFVCFTKDELEKRAKNRAMWSQIGMAALAGLAAAAQDNTTRITTMTPRGGIYTTTIQNPGLSAGQTATIAAGAGGIALSQYRLQQTLDELNDEVLQTTTIDPEDAYGGRAVITKLKKSKYPEKITVAVDFAGELHEFDFVVTKA